MSTKNVTRVRITEQSKPIQKLFAPTPEFVNSLSTAYQAEQIIRLHDNPHTEEMITAALGMFTPQGQAIWPGLDQQTPVHFMRKPQEMLRCRSGLMIGIGPADCSINEHHLEEETTTTEMMMRVLDIDPDHPLAPLGRIAYLDDVDASSKPDTLAADVRRRYLLKHKNLQVWQDTLRNLQYLFHQLVNVGDCRPLRSEQIRFAVDFFADQPIPQPIQGMINAVKDEEPGTDSLLVVNARTYFWEGSEVGKQQLAEMLTRWQIDYERSQPETLTPEVAAATEKIEMEIDGRPINLVVVDESKMVNPELLPWLLKFVRSPKSHNADVVVKIGSGKIMIQTNKKTHGRDPDNNKAWRRRPLVNLYGVSETLKQQEPGAWHALKRQGRVISLFGGGTINYDLTPSRLQKDDLIGIIKSYTWLV